MRNRLTAGLLAIVGWPLGLHRWYLNDAPGGCAYLALMGIGLFFWPVWFVVWLAGWIEGIGLLAMDDAAFARQFGGLDVEEPLAPPAPGARRPIFVIPNGMRGFPVRRTAEAEYRLRRPRDAAERERFVLQAAHEHRGVLTPADLAMEGHFTLAEAKAALDDLTQQAVCELEPTAQHLHRYVFPEFVADPAGPRLWQSEGQTDEDLHAT